jgi:hypothetical protein
VFIPLSAQIDLKEKAQLLGIQVDEKKGATEEEKLTDISFIFIERPSAYYHQRKDNLVIIEFFDAVLGEEELPAINQSPFANCKVCQEKVDVNREIEGLAPDFKDVVRVELAIEKGVNIDLTLTDDFNVISLSTTWTQGGEIVTEQTKEKSPKGKWILGSSLGAGLGTTAAILILIGNDPRLPDIPIWNPEPPDLPHGFKP